MIVIAASITCRGANSSATFEVNGVSFKMVAVQGGTFIMGATAEQGDEYDDDELPAHQVTLSTFYRTDRGHPATVGGGDGQPPSDYSGYSDFPRATATTGLVPVDAVTVA